jgi:hypothetical protein
MILEKICPYCKQPIPSPRVELRPSANIYDIYWNGKRIGWAVKNPANSAYHVSIMKEYDVSQTDIPEILSQIQEISNATCVYLTIGYFSKNTTYGSEFSRVFEDYPDDC